MGVQGLWELLAPVGRRVSVETLAGRKLAIDASIWMVQFMKAMRDEKGEMVRNAHLLGFFRRICKLLFLRTRPVFVFDGATPALKRRTIAARRRHRENARAKVRKTAEKLLLNHLKAKKLEELAAEIKNSRAKDDTKGKRVVSDQENDLSGTSIREGANENVLGVISQEGLDEMLAASLAAEEEEEFAGDEPSSSGKFPSEAEFDEDEDEEMAIPVIDGNVDPTVLASLPPSMQLDLLVQMRERLMAENRQKYQKIKKSPSKFSELQIQSYLKTVAFRREIDEVQKVAAGRGPEGVQTARIASEANREFIFSSSFTGDKRVFTSAGVEKNGDAGKTESCSRKESTSVDLLRGHLCSGQLKSPDQVNAAEPTKHFGHDVETYHDERGRIRVSRVRGLGIRMTRDLQRNLDLMREHEIDNTERNVHKNMEPTCSNEALNVSHKYSKDESPSIDRENNEDPRGDLNRCQGASMQKNQKDHSGEPSMVGNDTAIEVSFSMDEIVDKDDDLFSQLVAGSSTVQSSEVCSLGKSSIACDADFDWEEGAIEKKVTSNKTNNDSIIQALSEGRVISENDGLDWEEGELRTVLDHQIEHAKAVSRGSLEEEFEVQEAIRRSLEDLSQRSGSGSLLQVQTPKKSARDSSPTLLQCDTLESPTQHATAVDEFGLMDSAVEGCSLQTIDSAENYCSTMLSTDPGCKSSTTDVSNGSSHVCSHLFFTASGTHSNIVEKSQIDKVPTAALIGMQISEQESCLDISTRGEGKTNLRMSTDASTTSSSDLCARSTGKTERDLDRGDGTVLSDSYKIPEEDGYIHDTSANDSKGFHTESLESTLDEELLRLSHERRDLGDEQRKLERNAESVNSEMFAECQELLQMFGLPFIIAPMEAEAQCAYMELMNLVDGVVTDDSDVFLFGAQNVYKNIFDDRKYVETYLMKDIESELGLTREMLIRMALLLGSDYTEGVSGIGIVNAIEVVHAFPEEDGLKKFREWVESPDPAILRKLYPHLGDDSKKKLSKANSTCGDGCGSNAEDPLSNGKQENDVQSSSGDILDVKKTFMDKHRNVSKNWHFPSSFPSESVVSAYTNPQVDESTEPFAWGKPDVPLLRKFCWENFSWANQKADELLVPVLKEHNKHETQLRLEAFYTFNEKFAKIRSKRIKRAVKGITGNCSGGFAGDSEGGNIEIRKKRRQTSEAEENIYEEHSHGKCDCRKDSRQPKKQNSQKLLSDERHEKSSVQGGSIVKEMSESNVNGRRGMGRRGGGRGEGRGRKRGTGRGVRRESEEYTLESMETSSSDCGYHSTEKEKQVEVTCSSELRRSVRQRKHVEYAEGENMDDDDGDDYCDGISDFSKSRREICLDESAAAQELKNGSNTDVQDHGTGVIGDICCFDGSKSTTDREYLLSGGGFCIDDDDLKNANTTQPVSGAQENSVGSLPKVTGASDNLNVDMECSFNDNLKNIQEPLQEASVRHEETDILVEQEATRRTDYGFTAMTSLRRKQR